VCEQQLSVFSHLNEDESQPWLQCCCTEVVVVNISVPVRCVEFQLADWSCCFNYDAQSFYAYNNNNPWRYSSDEPWPAEQPPLAVFPDCTRRYWVDMWSAHRIPQLHFQLSKPDRYFFIQVTTQFIRSRG